MKRTQNTVLIVILLIIVVVAIAVYANRSKESGENDEMIACTKEAMICPDGTAVGRVGPQCEFAPCPDISIDTWKTFSDEATGVSYQYPAEFGTTYVQTVDWPPYIFITYKPTTCTQAGSATDRTGQTTERVIAGETYCVTEISEGAAGSVYTQYAYAHTEDSRTAIFTFSIRIPQCSNYDEPQRAECETEQATFSPDNVINRMMQTLQIN